MQKDIKAYDKYPLFHAIELLNQRMQEEDLAPIELNVCGGFAMMCHGLRAPGTKTDVDFAGEDLPLSVQKISEDIGTQLGIGYEWLNNDMVLSGTTFEDLEYATGELHFKPMFDMEKIKVNVLETRDLLKLKLIAIDTALMSVDLGGDFTRMKDFADIEKLLKKEKLSLCDCRNVFSEDLVATDALNLVAVYQKGGEKAVDVFVAKRQQVHRAYVARQAEKSLSNDTKSFIDQLIAEAQRKVDEEKMAEKSARAARGQER